MRKYLWLLFLILSASTLHAKDNKKKIAENQQYREALMLEQNRLLDEVAAIHKRLEDLTTLQLTKQEDLVKSQQSITKNLPFLVRLGRVNSLKLLVDPKVGQNTLRSIILVRALTESLKRQIHQTQTDLIEIRTLTKDFEGQEQANLKLLEAVELQKAQLLSLLDSTFETIKKNELDRLAGEDDINTLLDESRSALSKKGRSAAAAAKSKKLPFRRLERPVQGKIVEDPAVLNSIGVVFETKKDADVLAPSSGTIVFTGPFLDQGKMIILDHEKNVQSVFIGLDIITAQVGQKVYAREKIGTMAGYGSGSPKLFFELRQKGKAIDPKPYFAE